jgi:hypothetical protein
VDIVVESLRYVFLFLVALREKQFPVADEPANEVT